MSGAFVIDVDLAEVWADKSGKTYLRTLAWGDEIEVRHATPTTIEIVLTDFRKEKDGSIVPVKTSGFIVVKKSAGLKKASDALRPREKSKVLKINFVDVQQGDGAVIETPEGKVILVDGGDNQMFARYLAGRFRGTSASKPQPIECILVTHGDADHFEGLPEILKSETNERPRKRLFIEPKRVYHNGIVKRPGTVNRKKVAEDKLLGPTTTKGEGKNKEVYLTGLVDNLLEVPAAEMNKPFKAWRAALQTYNSRREIDFLRLEFGDDAAFDFLKDEEIEVSVLGPLTEQIDGRPALKFLHEPPKGPRGDDEVLDLGGDKFKGLSASHTINGHSVVFRLSYGGFHFLFSGDLNDEAGRFLTKEHNLGRLNLKAEVFKVPHHGSGDFSGAFIKAVEPIVSVVSSGDESARKEYIHPRATLMGALGKFSRTAEPLVFVTELVAFFNLEGEARLKDAKKSKKRGDFFAFSRTAYGIVKTRTDGQRLLVYTDSGNLKMKEAYAYALENGAAVPVKVRKV